jgi:hypothetical protein
MHGFLFSLNDLDYPKTFFQAPKNDTNTFFIGRQAGPNGIVVNDEWKNAQGVSGSRVSRIHCVVTCKVGGEFTVKDMSLCGTWIEHSDNRGTYSKLEKNTDSKVMHGDCLYLVDPRVVGTCPQHCVLECVYKMDACAKRTSPRLQDPNNRASKNRKV